MREENRSEIIHDALNLLDDELIEEVEKLRGGAVMERNISTNINNERRSWRKLVALAASICLLIVIGSVWNGSGLKDLSIFPQGEVSLDKENEDIFTKPESGGEEITDIDGLFEEEMESVDLEMENLGQAEGDVKETDALIKAFQNGKRVLTKDSPWKKEKIEQSDVLYHLYITTQDDVKWHFLILPDGYVTVDGSEDICVQIEEKVYEKIVDALENQ